MSWLDEVPTCTDAYAFQADLLCEDDGRAVAEKLRKRGASDDGDSGTFPQGPYGDGGGESDSTHFCGLGRACVNAVKVASHRVGCPLGNPLTTYGAELLQASVLDMLLSRKEYDQKLGRLLRRVWGDYVREERPARVPAKFRELPRSLEELCKRRKSSHGVVFDAPWEASFRDVDHVYLVARHVSRALAVVDVVELIRAPVDDDGEFTRLEVASIPAGVAAGLTPEALVLDAWGEMAWD